jgi:hypothetical protein
LHADADAEQGLAGQGQIAQRLKQAARLQPLLAIGESANAGQDQLLGALKRAGRRST